MTPTERAWFEDVAARRATEGGYAAGHRSRPQTAAFGLTDSRVGLAAWIVEKLRAWSDCGGDIERSFSRDEILTEVTLYWLTATSGSSMRMYRAKATTPPAQHARRVEVPFGFSLFPGDILRPPRAWLERTTNLALGYGYLDLTGNTSPRLPPDGSRTKPSRGLWSVRFLLQTIGERRDPSPRRNGRRQQLCGDKAGQLVRVLVDVLPPTAGRTWRRPPV